MTREIHVRTQPATTVLGTAGAWLAALLVLGAVLVLLVGGLLAMSHFATPQ